MKKLALRALIKYLSGLVMVALLVFLPAGTPSGTETGMGMTSSWPSWRTSGGRSKPGKPDLTAERAPRNPKVTL